MKKCKKCGCIKEIDNFYEHKRMLDGHLNICKDCVKLRIKRLYSVKSLNNDWMNKERERGRDKYFRLNYVSREPFLNKYLSQNQLNDYKLLRKRICKKYKIPKTSELHHWNYNSISSVFVLDKSIHKKLHNLLVFDENSLCYIYCGVLLDTAQKHFEFISESLTKFDIKETYIQFIEL